MKNVFCLFLFFFAFSLSAEIPSLTEALDSLDQVISHRKIYAQTKEMEIDALQKQLAQINNPEQRFSLLGKLVEANKSYNVSAQMACVRQRLDMANKMGNEEWRIHASLDMVECLYLVGMYKEAGDMLRKTEKKKLAGLFETILLSFE